MSAGNITRREKVLKEEKIAEGRFAFIACPRRDGYGIGIAVEGISGYFPTDYHSVPTLKEAELWASTINKRRRDNGGTLTVEDEVEIIASTMRNNPCR